MNASRRAKVEAMASQSASPNEALVARRMLNPSTTVASRGRLMAVLNDEHEVVQTADARAWAEAFGDFERRNVAQAEVGLTRVSTVFLGLDHGFGGKPKWFESMILESNGSHGSHDGMIYRYSTWDEAVAGHARIVAALTEGIEP